MIIVNKINLFYNMLNFFLEIFLKVVFEKTENFFWKIF